MLAVTILMVDSGAWAAGNSWSTASSMGTARAFAAAVELGGHVYVLGGHKDTGELGIAERYSPSSDSWTSSNMPYKLTGMMAVAHGGKVWTFGGFFNIQGWDEPWNGIQVYDATANAWQGEGYTPMPTKRGMGTAQAVNGKAYVMGGHVCSGSGSSYECVPTDKVEIYDFASDSWTSRPPIPSALSFTASVLIDGKIWVVGGVDRSFTDTPAWTSYDGYMTDKVFIFDSASASWDESQPMTSKRSHHAAFYAHGWLYVVGGHLYQSSGYPVTNTMFAYSPSEERWTTATSMPTARAGLGAAVAEGKAFVVAGRTDQGSYSTRNEEYTPFVPDPPPSSSPGPTQSQPNPPSAAFSYELGTDPANPRKVSFDASASSDADGSITGYQWDFGDGDEFSSTGPAVWHIYSSDGTFKTAVTVTDNSGAQASAETWDTADGVAFTDAD